MQPSLDTIIHLAQFTSGRRIHALLEVRAVAVALGDTALVQRIDAALADDRRTRALDNRWSGRRSKPDHSDEAKEIDRAVDQLLTSIRDAAEMYTKSAFAGTTMESHAVRFLGVAFPNGVQPITSLPFVDQVAAVEVLLEAFGGELAAQVAALHLDPLVLRLKEITVEYRAAVYNSRDDLDFATVQAARARGQRNLLEIVAMIAGAYYSHTQADHVERRARLLQPILEQDRLIRSYLAARRSVPDLDSDVPEDVVPGDAAPAEVAPATAAPSIDDATSPA